MLSTKSGDLIGVVKKGSKIVKKVYLNEINTSNDDEIEDNNNDNSALMPKSFYTGLRGITPSNIIILKRAIRNNNIDIIPKAHTTMLDAYKQSRILLKELSSKTIIIKPDEGTIQLYPPDKHVAVGVWGPSGVGKSYWVSNFINEYQHKYKKDCDVYIFSSITDDPAFEKLKLTYIKIDDSVITDPFNLSEFGLNKHNLVIFDDIESLHNNHYKAIAEFRSKCLECGRHQNIDIIAIHHVIQAGNCTKKIINECDYSVVYPRCNFNSIEKLLKNTYGFGKDEVNYVKELGRKSRAIIIKRSYPSYIMSDHEIKVV